MSILSGHKKYERYLKTNNGYQLCSMKTYADSVHFSDGTTVQNNLGAIKGITDSLTATSSNVALSAAAGNNLQTQVSELNSNLSNTVKTSGKNIIRHDTVGDISAYENGGLIIQSSSGNVPAISLIRQGVSGCAIELYENKDLRVVFNTGETYSVNMTRIG